MSPFVFVRTPGFHIRRTGEDPEEPEEDEDAEECGEYEDSQEGPDNSPEAIKARASMAEEDGSQQHVWKQH